MALPPLVGAAVRVAAPAGVVRQQRGGEEAAVGGYPAAGGRVRAL